jgi:hypothetical protein
VGAFALNYVKLKLKKAEFLKSHPTLPTVPWIIAQCQDNSRDAIAGSTWPFLSAYGHLCRSCLECSMWMNSFALTSTGELGTTHIHISWAKGNWGSIGRKNSRKWVCLQIFKVLSIQSYLIKSFFLLVYGHFFLWGVNFPLGCKGRSCTGMIKTASFWWEREFSLEILISNVTLHVYFDICIPYCSVYIPHQYSYSDFIDSRKPSTVRCTVTFQTTKKEGKKNLPTKLWYIPLVVRHCLICEG